MTCLFPRFTDGVSIVARNGQHLTLDIQERGQVRLKGSHPGVIDALASLAGGGQSEQELAKLAGRADGVEGAARFEHAFRLLRQQLLIGYEWLHDGQAQAFLEPKHGGLRLHDKPLPAGPLLLSRFAYARRDGAHLVLESPSASCRIVLKTPQAAGWLSYFVDGAGASDDSSQAFAELLWRTEFAEECANEESNHRATWEFHDLLFHTCSRQGFDSGPRGGTYRFVDKFPPPPALKPPMSGTVIRLGGFRQLDNACSESLSSVMDRRRSIRQTGDQSPITAAQIAELLHRVARIKSVEHGAPQEVLARPFPTGGAIHELEFYLAIRLCDGLDAGLYHYHGLEHALYRLPASSDQIAPLIKDAAIAMGQPESPPQCVILLASRLPRLAWKYQAIAYRLTLMNAGVVFQTLYLVATAMNLACSALGNGNSVSFARATGLDPLEETSVAEFALGSLSQPAGCR